MALPKLDALQLLIDQLTLHRCANILARDLLACIRCGACERACKLRHGTVRLSGQWENCGALELAPVCRNCETPACIGTCPRQAIHKEGRGVIINPERCIGCQLCTKACPFGSLTMIPKEANTCSLTPPPNPQNRVAVTCDRCSGFHHRGCQRECPTGALRFLRLNKVLLMAQRGPMAPIMATSLRICPPTDRGSIRFPLFSKKCCAT